MSDAKASSHARRVVDDFGAAFAKKDFDGARRLLQDNLSFHGPIDTFSRADDYVASLTRLGTMMKGIRHEKTIADGNEVAVFYVLDTALGSAPVADWYTVATARSHPFTRTSMRVRLLRLPGLKPPTEHPLPTARG
jgi:hypothetical protein